MDGSPPSRTEFAALLDRLRGREQRRSSAMDVIDAARLVRDGTVVSLGEAPPEPALAADDVTTPAAPTAYRLTQWTETGDGWTAVNDRLELDIHGAPSMTHLDMPSHFSWHGSPPRGSLHPSLLELARQGLVARGVLIDVPGVAGRSQPAAPIRLDEVLRFLEDTDVQLRAGDALHLRFGRIAPNRSDVALGAEPTPGLSIECAEWIAEQEPSVIITDEGLDPFPSEIEGLPVPWHVLVLTSLGIPLIDRAALGPLSVACRQAGRWDFLSVIAPLPIPTASGSPVNPLAIL